MCYSKLCLRAVSQVTEKRKTWEILGESQNWWGQSLVPNVPFRNNFLVIESEITDIKVFCSCQNSLNF